MDHVEIIDIDSLNRFCIYTAAQGVRKDSNSLVNINMDQKVAHSEQIRND